jgi:signal transduction histidine kinase
LDYLLYFMPTFGFQPPGLLQTIFEDIGVGVVVVDREERVVFANRTALQMLDAPNTVNGTYFSELRQKFRFEDVSGKEISLANSAIVRALKGERVEAQEAHVRKANGETKWLITWTYRFSVMGLEGVVALVIDQTAEVELRRIAVQMQKMETLGTLAVGLTHDFNNVLNTISMNVALAKGTRDCPESLRPRFEQMSGAVDKASGLIKRLMQFSRTQELHLQSVGVNHVVEDVLRLIQPLLGQNVSLKVDLAPGLPFVHADVSQIEQALMNLIVNALDAMPEGGNLTISTKLAHATSASKKQEEVVQMSVEDTGTGIPAEIQSAIFEPFFTTKSEGTGLGLSSTFVIIRQHDGNIEVNSSPGKGTIFTVSLPAELSVPRRDRA